MKNLDNLIRHLNTRTLELVLEDLEEIGGADRIKNFRESHHTLLMLSHLRDGVLAELNLRECPP